MFHVGGQPDNCRFFSRVPPSPSIAEEERHVFTPIPQPARKFLTLGRTCTALECGEGHRRCDRHRERIVSLAVDQGSQEQSKAVDGCVTHPDTRDNTQSDGTGSPHIATPASCSDCSDSDCSCSDCDQEERHAFISTPQLEGEFLPLTRCTSLACGEGYNRSCDRLWKWAMSSVADQGSQEQAKAVDGCVTHPDTRDNSQSDGTDSSRIATPCSYSDGSASDCSCSDCDPDSYCDLGTYYNLAPDCDFRRFATARCLIVKSLPRFDDTVATGQDHTEGQSQSPQRSAQTAPEDHNGPDVTATVGKKVSDIPDSESPLTE